jgi:hypothetical protein
MNEYLDLYLTNLELSQNPLPLYEVENSSKYGRVGFRRLTLDGFFEASLEALKNKNVGMDGYSFYDLLKVSLFRWSFVRIAEDVTPVFSLSLASLSKEDCKNYISLIEKQISFSAVYVEYVQAINLIRFNPYPKKERTVQIKEAEEVLVKAIKDSDHFKSANEALQEISNKITTLEFSIKSLQSAVVNKGAKTHVLKGILSKFDKYRPNIRTFKSHCFDLGINSKVLGEHKNLCDDFYNSYRCKINKNYEKYDIFINKVRDKHITKWRKYIPQSKQHMVDDVEADYLKLKEVGSNGSHTD